MENSIAPVDPDLVAKSALHALGDIISKCSPEVQPQPHLLDAFLKLYLEVKGAPDGIAKLIAEIRDGQAETRKHVGLIAQGMTAKAMGSQWTRS